MLRTFHRSFQPAATIGFTRPLCSFFLLLERFLFTFFVHVFCSNRLWTLQPVLSKTVETAIVLLQNEFAEADWKETYFAC